MARTLNFTKQSRTYATFVSAAKAALTVCGKLPDEVQDGITVVISHTDDGRYAPVFCLTPAAHCVAAEIARRGYHVVG